MLFNKDDFILSIPHQFRHMFDWQALASTTLWGFTIAETVRYTVTAVSEPASQTPKKNQIMLQRRSILRKDYRLRIAPWALKLEP
jgi:hypothetical protein